MAKIQAEELSMLEREIEEKKKIMKQEMLQQLKRVYFEDNK